jgi:hypothetical protein
MDSYSLFECSQAKAFSRNRSPISIFMCLVHVQLHVQLVSLLQKFQLILPYAKLTHRTIELREKLGYGIYANFVLYPPVSALVCASGAWRVQHVKLVIDNRVFTNSSFRLIIFNSVSNAFRGCGSCLGGLSFSIALRSFMAASFASNFHCVFNYLSF